MFNFNHGNSCVFHVDASNRIDNLIPDKSGYGQHVTITLQVECTSNGIDFAHSNAFASCQGKTIKETCNKSFTVEAVIRTSTKLPDQNGGGFIVCMTGFCYLEQSCSGKVRVYTHTSSNPGYHESVQVLQPNTVYHLCYTYNAVLGEHRIYINNYLDTLVLGVHCGSPYDYKTLCIGKRNDGTYPFYGKLFCARIYKHALDPYHIEYNFKASNIMQY